LGVPEGGSVSPRRARTRRMKSHTVPRKLLEQFAYNDPHTKSLRLWRYEKGRAPYRKASPESATRIDGHFADPGDAEKESQLEARLAREYEEPVNQFLFSLGDPSFALTELHRRQLTLYVTLLFNRSQARRAATLHQQELTVQALDAFLSNETQLLTVAAKWNIDLLLSGRQIPSLITKEEVARIAVGLRERSRTERQRQESYVGLIERAMSYLDGEIFKGRWDCLRTPADDPFIISDAPVVTWERIEPGVFSYGQGFHRPDVEAFLPLSPVTCLHIIPSVERTRPVQLPTVSEINAAEAAFSSRFCFTNVNSPRIDEIVQRNYGKARMGVNAFTLWHRNYDNVFYELLMQDGKWADPPLRTK
jgi:hypothetical protein